MLAMSTDDMSDRMSYLNAALTLGAADVLRKPFTIDALSGAAVLFILAMGLLWSCAGD